MEPTFKGVDCFWRLLFLVSVPSSIVLSMMAIVAWIFLFQKQLFAFMAPTASMAPSARATPEAARRAAGAEATSEAPLIETQARKTGRSTR
jgi:hypothetical protein